MQSSYSIIKNKAVNVRDNIDIKTTYDAKNIVYINDEAELVRAKQSLESMKTLILGNINAQKDKILNQAVQNAKLIEKEAYQKGYEEGLSNGKEDGYKEAYEGNIKLAEKLVEDAKFLLQNSKIEYEKYLEDKKVEIIELAYKVSEHILEKNLTRDDGINELISKALESSRESKTFIIRCNPTQIESVKEIIEHELKTNGNKTEVHCIEDMSIETGNAVIELDKGTITLGLENAIESIRKEVF
ncbi:MAG: FliH/SctL family protein [Sarcina sp.]